MKKYKEYVCQCKKCISCCENRPCWPTPQEAKKLIENKFGKQLMLDYWEDDENIYIVSPAIKRYEGRHAPYTPKGKCTFLDSNNLCKLHDLGLKPLEGKVSGCKKSYPNLHHDVAMLWDSNEGRKVVELWKTRLNN